MNVSSAEILKYAGLVIACLSSIIGLSLNYRKHGKITPIGRSLILLAILGIILAIIGDRIENSETKTKERITTEWERVLDEPIISVVVGRYITGNMQLHELIETLNRQEITFGSTKNGSDPKNNRKIEIVDNSWQTNSDKCDSTTIEVKLVLIDCRTDSVVAGNDGHVYFGQIDDGWVEAYFSSARAWRSINDYACGVSGEIPWGRYSFDDVVSVRDLYRMSFNFKAPDILLSENSTFRHLKDGDPICVVEVLIKTPAFNFNMNIGALGCLELVDQTSAMEGHFVTSSISGYNLLTFLKYQFDEAGGIHSDKLESEQYSSMRIVRQTYLGWIMEKKLMKL